MRAAIFDAPGKPLRLADQLDLTHTMLDIAGVADETDLGRFGNLLA